MVPTLKVVGKYGGQAVKVIMVFGKRSHHPQTTAAISAVRALEPREYYLVEFLRWRFSLSPGRNACITVPTLRGVSQKEAQSTHLQWQFFCRMRATICKKNNNQTGNDGDCVNPGLYVFKFGRNTKLYIKCVYLLKRQKLWVFWPMQITKVLQNPRTAAEHTLENDWEQFPDGVGRCVQSNSGSHAATVGLTRHASREDSVSHAGALAEQHVPPRPASLRPTPGN